jgi:hypothetical protein
LLIRHRMYMKKKFPSRTSLSLTETVQNVCPMQIYTRRNLSFCDAFRIPFLHADPKPAAFISTFTS